MTEKPTSLATDLEAIRRALAPLAEMTARMRFRNAVANALIACLNGDDTRAAAELHGLDDAQLHAIEGAASGLAIHASRHRKRLAAQADGEDGAERPDGPGDESVCDEPTCICHDLAVPNDDDGRDPLAAARDLTEQQAAGCPLNCPPGYCRADAAPDDEQPDEASDEYDLDTDPDALRRNLDEVIVFLDGRGSKMVHDAVWARVRPVLRIHREKLAEQRQRADQAEAGRAAAVRQAEAHVNISRQHEIRREQAEQRAEAAEAEQRRLSAERDELAEGNAALDEAIGAVTRRALASEAAERRVRQVLSGKARLCGPAAVPMVPVDAVHAALDAETAP